MECAKCGHPVGTPAYTIYGNTSDNFCSRACVDATMQKHGGRRKKKMEQIAPDFGASGVVRYLCDRCQAPLGHKPDGSTNIAWKGRDGTYCSHTCLVQSEREDTMPNENPIITAPTVETKEKKPKAVKPAIKVGKPATKDAKKVEKVTKPSPKTKATPPAPKTAEVKTTKVKATSADSKADMVITMLRKGATTVSIMEATGWQAHTVRGFISGNLRTRQGLSVVKENGKYFIK